MENRRRPALPHSPLGAPRKTGPPPSCRSRSALPKGVDGSLQFSPGVTELLRQHRSTRRTSVGGRRIPPFRSAWTSSGTLSAETHGCAHTVVFIFSYYIRPGARSTPRRLRDLQLIDLES